MNGVENPLASPVVVANNVDKADPEGYSAEAFHFIREKWIKEQMRGRVNEFTEQKTMRFFCGTWNVNAKKPSQEQEPLANWLINEKLPLPDVYCIGFQEIVDLNAVNLLTDHSASDPWEVLIEDTLKKQYVKVAGHHLVGVALLVYVKRELRSVITEVEVQNVGVGIMGVGGNKGGVAIRFRMHDSTVCVINSHLAAHKHNVMGRNADFANIYKRLSFPPLKQSSGEQISDLTTIDDHDILFWIGDLNYRLNMQDLKLCYDKVETKDYKFLLQHDQLILEKQAGNTFQNWKEAEINFPPTYKYEPGTDKFEQVKMRFPAWCDRVQWKGSEIKSLYYNSANLKSSDHKPVASLLEAILKIRVKEREQAVYSSIVRQLDAWENEAIPKVALSKNSLQFSDILFDTIVKDYIHIENVGVGAVKFRFVPKLEEQSYSKKWLSVVPNTGFLPPNGSMDLELSIQVDRSNAQALITEEEKLQDILILRLENGRDYFITVSGEYLKSCFGSTIDYLVTIPGPIRDHKISNNNNKNRSQTLSVPKELWRMVDYIYNKGIDEEGLFVTSGDINQIKRIRECLDTGQEFGAFDIHSMAETLVRFLESLAEPVFPNVLAQDLPNNMSLTAFCMQALVKLPPVKYNTFIYITSFLREVLKHSAQNRTTIDQLVFIFSSCLMHWDTQKFASKMEAPRESTEWKILSHFLKSDDFS